MRRPIRCILGRHTGQAQGGTLMFTCPRCRGSFFQRDDYSAVERKADVLIDAGRTDDALRLVRDALRNAR